MRTSYPQDCKLTAFRIAIKRPGGGGAQHETCTHNQTEPMQCTGKSSFPRKQGSVQPCIQPAGIQIRITRTPCSSSQLKNVNSIHSPMLLAPLSTLQGHNTTRFFHLIISRIFHFYFRSVLVNTLGCLQTQNLFNSYHFWGWRTHLF